MSVDDLVAELTAHADDATRPALRPIIERLTRPLRVRATGRVGVGVHTLTDALRDAGLTVADARAEVEVLVIAASANDDPAALQIVISIARRFKQRSVRERAAELVEQIAARRGWSTEELADRTIPTAGFPTADEVAAEGEEQPTENGVAILDYGSRHFTMRIGPDLGLALFTADGTPLKALPKAGVKDDAELAKEARATVTSAKKELNQVVALQTARLHEAMALQRTWTASTWRDAFSNHPVMRHLVSRLIWAAGPVGEDGTPLEGAAVTLLLPTLDGELLDADDVDVVLAPDSRLWLAHASLLDPATVALWRARLTDYGVTPLVDQFTQVERAAPSFAAGATELNDREGWVLTIGALRTRVARQGFQLASAEDGGWISSVVKDVGSWRAVVDMTGTYPGQEVGESLALTRLTVERAGRAVPLEQVPPVLLAVVFDDYCAIADGGAFDPEWKKRTGW